MPSPLHYAVLLAGAACALAPALAQTPAASKTTSATVKPPAGGFTGPREKMVVAMPKTYGKSETMALWGDYFSHLSRCGNIDLHNAQNESLERSSNVDTLGEKELIDGIVAGKVQLAQVNPGLVPQLVAAGQPAPFAVPGNKVSGQQNSYKLILITRVDSPYTKPKDLVGKKLRTPHRPPTQATLRRVRCFQHLA